MKKCITGLLACLMLSCPLGVGAADFKVNPSVNYDNETITVTGTTPALYGQNVSVVIYKPAVNISGMGDVLDRNHPELHLPLQAENIKKIRNVTADLSGKFETTFNLSDLEPGYYIVSATGGGYKSSTSKDSEMIYFESSDSIDNVTIPRISSATKDTIGEIIREKELLLGINVSGDYNQNYDVINNLFETIKNDDFGGSYSAGEMSKVQDTFERIQLLRDMYAQGSAQGINTLIKNNNNLFGMNLSDPVYVNNSDDVMEIYHNIVKDAKDKGIYHPSSMKSSRDVFKESMGIVEINNSRNTDMYGLIEKYGEALGINWNTYKQNCDNYTAVEVNKAFVERNFKIPANVVAAYNSTISDLASQNSGSGGNGGGGNGGNSGSVSSGGGKGDSYISISKDIVENNIPKDEMPTKFSDVLSSHWAYEAVQTLAEMNVIDGKGDGTYAPSELVSREQFIKMLVLAGGYYDSSLNSEFTDVAKDRWSNAYIASAVSRGIVTGYGDKTFAPTASITRQDAAVMAYRLCNVKKIKLTVDTGADFTDFDSVNDYAKDAISSLAASKIINGFEDGSFRGGGTLTRAQAAKIIYELLKKQ